MHDLRNPNRAGEAGDRDMPLEHAFQDVEDQQRFLFIEDPRRAQRLEEGEPLHLERRRDILEAQAVALGAVSSVGQLGRDWNHQGVGTIINDNLHLLLSANTIISGTENTTAYYAANLKKKQTFPNAWYSALRQSLKGGSLSGPRVAKVMGHNPCFGDKLMDWQDPDPGIYSQTNQVWP